MANYNDYSLTKGTKTKLKMFTHCLPSFSFNYEKTVFTVMVNISININNIQLLTFVEVNIYRILGILFLGLTLPFDKVSPNNKMPNILFIGNL